MVSVSEMNGEVSEMNGEVSEMNGEVSEMNGEVSEKYLYKYSSFNYWCNTLPVINILVLWQET